MGEHGINRVEDCRVVEYTIMRRWKWYDENALGISRVTELTCLRCFSPSVNRRPWKGITVVTDLT